MKRRSRSAADWRGICRASRRAGSIATSPCEACRRAMGEMAALEMAMRELKRHCAAAALDEGFAAELAGKLAAGDGNVLPLRQFVRRAAQDARLRQALQAASDPAAFVALCVRLGRERGFRFSAAQVEALLGAEAANESELSDEQLDRVAAGAGFDALRLLDWLNRP